MPLFRLLRPLLSLSAGLFLSAVSGATTPDAVTQPLFSESFDSDTALAAWSPGGELDERAVRIASKGTDVTTVVRHPLPPASLAGRTVRVSARMKSAGISAPPAAHNGIKLRLDITGADGKRIFFQARVAHAESSDWKEIEFSRAVPAGITGASVALGIERVAGTVWFDDVKVEVLP